MELLKSFRWVKKKSELHRKLHTCKHSDCLAVCVKSIGISQPVDEAYSRLTTRQPERFWTSGQWMTERQGGSDVGQ